MTFRYRPGQEPQQQLESLEKELGIQNLQDVQVDEEALTLYIFTATHKYSVALTLVS